MASKTLKTPQKLMCIEGDLIEIDRGHYNHWAVYVGNHEVVHLTGADEGASNSGHSFSVSGVLYKKGIVKKESIFNVVGRSGWRVNNDKDKIVGFVHTAEQIVKRALNMIGPINYDVLWNNCEHFASWCRNNYEMSGQARNVAKGCVAVAAAVVGGKLLWNYFKKDDADVS